MRWYSFLANDRPDYMALAWRLRFRVFNDALKWEIPAHSELEFDKYDLEATHCGLFDQGKLLGYYRALRTDRPYLLQESFPDLANGLVLPSSPRVWEISRMAIEPTLSRQVKRDVGRNLTAAFVEQAYLNNATSVIGITEPGFENFLSKCGFTLNRLTDPVVVGSSGHGPVKAIITECPISTDNLKAAGVDFAIAA